jgi:hypothetical protein
VVATCCSWGNETLNLDYKKSMKMTEDHFVKFSLNFLRWRAISLYWLIRNWQQTFHKSCLIWKHGNKIVFCSWCRKQVTTYLIYLKSTLLPFQISWFLHIIVLQYSRHTFMAAITWIKARSSTCLYKIN